MPSARARPWPRSTRRSSTADSDDRRNGASMPGAAAGAGRARARSRCTPCPRSGTLRRRRRASGRPTGNPTGCAPERRRSRRATCAAEVTLGLRASTRRTARPRPARRARTSDRSGADHAEPPRFRAHPGRWRSCWGRPVTPTLPIRALDRWSKANSRWCVRELACDRTVPSRCDGECASAGMRSARLRCVFARGEIRLARASLDASRAVRRARSSGCRAGKRSDIAYDARVGRRTRRPAFAGVPASLCAFCGAERSSRAKSSCRTGIAVLRSSVGVCEAGRVVAA